MYVNNGHKTHVQELNISKIEKRKKIQDGPHYIPQNINIPPNKMVLY